MRFLSILFLLLLHLPTFSQTKQGSLLFNLDGYVIGEIFKGNSYSGGNRQLELGYAFFNNFFLGAKYRLSYLIDFDQKNSFNIPEYGLFSRYYFFKNKNRLYLQTDFNHTNGPLASTHDEWNAGVGFNHFLNPYVALEAHLNYNFYNRIALNDPSRVINNPISAPVNDPQGFELGLRFRFFVPAGLGPQPEKPPLAVRYLKKGNKRIGLSGQVEFDPVAHLGVFEKSRFLNDKLRILHRYFGWGSFGKNHYTQGLATYAAFLEKYLPIHGNLYFTPSLGAGPMLQYEDGFKYKNWGWTGSAQVGFVQFFKNSSVGMGITLNSFDFFRKYNELTLTSNLYLSPEIFLTETFAFKPILYYNLLDEPTLLFFFQNENFVSVDKFRLQFGFSYYY